MVVLKGMKSIVLVIVCLFIGFVVGRQTMNEEVITKYVKCETIRDTITQFIPDTVYLTGELKYKYVYKTDTIYKDIPVIDRDATMTATVEDWNKVREYRRILIDNENGRLSFDLKVQYNELQRLSYSFTPIHGKITIVKKRVFEPFVSTSFCTNNTFSVGGGFFYHDLGFRVEWMADGLNFGVLYKF